MKSRIAPTCDGEYTDGVIYARYSPGPNQTDQSIEGQLRDCTRFCEENNIRVVGTYIDKKQTGRNNNRINFQKMLHDSKRKLFKTVVVWKIDRFGRDREEMAKNKSILRMNDVRVLSAKEHIPNGPEGIILESVLEGLAEYYSANLSQNIIRGMRESALKCQFNGSGLSLGYTVDKEHKFHIDPDSATVVRLIFNKYDGGEKIADILRYIQSQGIKTLRGKEFTNYGISRVLRNRAYIGEYRWQDVIIPDGMPKIIENDLFERVQHRMEINKKAPSAGRGKIDFLLTSKIFCGLCKSTMTGDSGTGRSGNKWYYYSCRGRKSLKNGCKKKSVHKEWLEREVVKLTCTYILQDDVIKYIADRVVTIQKEEHDDASMLQYYEGQLKETSTSIHNIMKAIEAGIITDTTRERLMELEVVKGDIEMEIAKEKITRPLLKREQVIYYLEKFKGGDIDDKEYQRKIIDMFISKVFLYDDKIIITYNYSGDKKEVTAEIIEEAAFEAASDTNMSGVRISSPPLDQNKDPSPFSDWGFYFCFVGI